MKIIPIKNLQSGDMFDYYDTYCTCITNKLVQGSDDVGIYYSFYVCVAFNMLDCIIHTLCLRTTQIIKIV